jgi:hypothetical protein
MKWLCALALSAIAAHAAAVVIPVPISVPGTGFVSVALLDANGVLIRTLAYAEAVGAGTRTFLWDGTTDLGLPALPGSYTTRAVFFSSAPATRFVLKAGTSGNPPWRLKNGTGDWGGDLGGPSTITANSTSLVVAWSAVENQRFLSGLQQIDTNGNVIYTYLTFYPYDGRLAGAMDNTNLFLGILNRNAQRIEIAKYELGTSNKSILVNLPTPPHYTLSGRWKGRWQADLDGMALTGNRIFASMALDDRLFILDRATGAILQQLSLPSPRGLAISGDRLLVVSSNSVLKLTFAGAVESTLVSGAPLSDPYAISADASGNFYVSDGGSKQIDPDAITGNHQVHVFATNGSHLRSIGVPGGSPRSGFFNRHGFGDVRSLCIGPDHKLWANEEITGFKRTSRWTTNGVLEREWFQRKLTHLADLMNPARPNELIYPANAYEDYPALTAYTIDWTNQTWTPAWSYAQTDTEMYQEEIYLSNQHSHALQEYQPGKRRPVFHYSPTELVPFNGRNYFINHSGNGDGAIFTYTETNQPRPVALVGYHHVDIITNKVVSYYDTGPNQWFTWADADGDARMAMSEFTFTTNSTALALSKRVWEARLETNLNIRLLRAIGSNGLMESILPLKQLLPNGAPVYDWALLQDLTLRDMPKFEGGDGWKKVTRVNDDWVPVTDGNAEYTLVDPNTSAALNLPSLDHFWANRNWRKRIVKFEQSTGKFLWAAGRRAPARALNGEMYNPFGISVSHGAVFTADVLGMIWLWSTDGLYLGRLLHDAEPGRTWDEYAVHAELQGPVTLFTNAATGKLYMIVNDTGAHAYEVTLPSLQPLAAGAVQLTAAMSAQARAWDPDDRIPIAGSLLEVSRAGASLILSWHTNAASMALQSATLPSGPWTTITPARTTNGVTISVTVPVVTARQFYRLMQ